MAFRQTQTVPSQYGTPTEVTADTHISGTTFKPDGGDIVIQLSANEASSGVGLPSVEYVFPKVGEPPSPAELDDETGEVLVAEGEKDPGTLLTRDQFLDLPLPQGEVRCKTIRDLYNQQKFAGYTMIKAMDARFADSTEV